MSKLLKKLIGTAVTVLVLGASVSEASGLRLGEAGDAIPVAGSALGGVAFIFSDLGTGPCAGFPPAPNPDTGELNNAQSTTTSEGWLSHVGWVEMDTAHCFNILLDEWGIPVLDENGFPIFLSQNGMFEIRTVNGDTIFGSYEGVQLTPGVLPQDGDLIINEGVFQIEGGTGAFEGASGKLVHRVYVQVNQANVYDSWTVRFMISGLADLAD